MGNCSHSSWLLGPSYHSSESKIFQCVLASGPEPWMAMIEFLEVSIHHTWQHFGNFILHLFYTESKENSFNRSRSSSVSSIDKESKEAITALYFMESFSRKMDSTLSPCLWLGTSLGTVLVISLNLPPEEQRYSEPLMVSPSGKKCLYIYFIG